MYASAYDFIWDSLLTATVGLYVTKLLPSGQTAVDLGCGTGLSSAWLQGVGYQVIGVDASPEMLRRALRAGRVDRAVLSDAVGCGLGLECADVVLAVNLLQVHSRPGEVLDQAQRLLKPGGVLVCVWPSASASISRLFLAEVNLGRPWLSAASAFLARVAIGLIGLPYRARRLSSEAVENVVDHWIASNGMDVIDAGSVMAIEDFRVISRAHPEALTDGKTRQNAPFGAVLARLSVSQSGADRVSSP